VYSSQWRKPATLLAATLTVIGSQPTFAQPPGSFQPCSPQVNIQATLPTSPSTEDPDVAAVNAFIGATEAAAVAAIPAATDLSHQIELLGEVEIYDRSISPAENIGCATCHAANVGFTSGVSLYNQTIVANEGGTLITNATPPAPNVRISGRKPQSYAYATYSPVLHYNATQGDFVGGNFWDMRATGTRLNSPAAEQAQGPPLNPVELGNQDSACIIYKISVGQYASLFKTVWGADSFAMTWPSNVAQICAQPGPPPADNPYPVQLSASDRALSNTDFDHFAMAIAAYEASPAVSPFSSKFDYAVANPTQTVLTPLEQQGWNLFRGKAMCNTCHLDGTSASPQTNFFTDALPSNEADVEAVFTDFTSANLGLPKNTNMPFYCENKPDQYGYTANPMGLSFTDNGVGAFIDGAQGSAVPNSTWAQYAPQFNGKFQVPTTRNVDLRPRRDFVKDYMHNGYLKSLKEVVHFYNTRDVYKYSVNIGNCPANTTEKVNCWPQPEVQDNIDKTVGSLGLTDQEENAVVAFLQTLSDGFSPGSAGLSLSAAAKQQKTK
jgi:cytochrome c peroxidase